MKDRVIVVATERNIRDDYEAIVLDTILENGNTKYLVKLISAYCRDSERRISHGTKTDCIRVINPDEIVMLLDQKK